MNRRGLLKSAAATCALGYLSPSFAHVQSKYRVRPSDRLWPNAARWNDLQRKIEGRLLEVHPPFDGCRNNAKACKVLIENLKNPFFIGDQTWATQISGWTGAWSSQSSVYAVAARSASDVAAAVNFASDHNLRLVVKGGGHSYQGTSNAPDSLLIWTRPMRRIEMHDAFFGRNWPKGKPAVPAVTVQSGAVWMDVYDAVTTKGGRCSRWRLRDRRCRWAHSERGLR
jgi:hypothetical protein